MKITKSVFPKSLAGRWLESQAKIILAEGYHVCGNTLPSGRKIAHVNHTCNHGAACRNGYDERFELGMAEYLDEADGLSQVVRSLRTQVLIWVNDEWVFESGIPRNIREEITFYAEQSGQLYNILMASAFVDLSPGSDVIIDYPPIQEDTLLPHSLNQIPWVRNTISESFLLEESISNPFHLPGEHCPLDDCLSSQEEIDFISDYPDSPTKAELVRGHSVWCYWYSDDSIFLVVSIDGEEMHYRVPENEKLDIKQQALIEHRLWER